MPSPIYPSIEVLFQLHGGMVSHMQVLAIYFFFKGDVRMAKRFSKKYGNKG